MRPPGNISAYAYLLLDGFTLEPQQEQLIPIFTSLCKKRRYPTELESRCSRVLAILCADQVRNCQSREPVYRLKQARLKLNHARSIAKFG
jgi:hypothetical protein